MSTHNIHLKYRTPKRYPTVISIVPPGEALIVTFRGSNYRCLKQIFMVPKGFEPSKFDCICFEGQHYVRLHHGSWAWKTSTLQLCFFFLSVGVHCKRDYSFQYLFYFTTSAVSAVWRG